MCSTRRHHRRRVGSYVVAGEDKKMVDLKLLFPLFLSPPLSFYARDEGHRYLQNK